MKKISILIPTYNEENNVMALYLELIKYLTNIKYDYEIIFIDNYSTDNTRNLIRKLCSEDKHVKAIFYAKNFGPLKNIYYGFQQTTGDCTILIFADLQDPPSLIPKLIEEWEKGYKVVVAKKTKSHEGAISILRGIYYKIMTILSQIDQFHNISNFNGFGLYDKEFISVFKSIKDPEPYFKNIIAQFGYNIKEVYYEHQKRHYGKSRVSFYKAYDIAMLSIVSYSKIILRIAIIFGFILSLITFIIGINGFIQKLLHWDSYTFGSAATLVGVFFIGSVQLFFIGLLGEYILNINLRIVQKPLVIEEERINFDE